MANKDLVEFKGTVIRSIYSSERFKVYSLDVDSERYPNVIKNKYNNVSISGKMPELTEGFQYEITAKAEDGRYGIEYKVKNIRKDEKMEGNDVLVFLNVCLPSSRASVMYNSYPDILERIKNDNLSDIDVSNMRGYGKPTFSKDIAKLKEKLPMYDVIKTYGGVLSFSEINKLIKRYGFADAIKKELNNHPYKTLIGMSGIGFKKADDIVLRLNNANLINSIDNVLCSAERCYAAVIYLLEENEKNGNTIANVVDVRRQCIELAGESVHHFEDVVKDNVFYYDAEMLRIALKKTYMNEQYIAESIVYGTKDKNVWSVDCSIYKVVDGLELTQDQLSVLPMVCENNVSMLIGYAGSGKTTSMKALIRMLDDNYMTYKLLAPTGRAAKVMKETTGKEASTVHRGLGFTPGFGGWKFNKENKLECDIVLVDEFSMVDVNLMTHIIDAVDFTKTKLLMIGDAAQAASVGAGSVFDNIINSNTVPYVMLDKIFRYTSNGLIKVATDVRNNEVYLKDPKYSKVSVFGEDKDYVFINSDNDHTVADVVTVYKKLINNGCNPMDIRVLSAYNIGDFGSIAFNSHIQKIANPKKESAPYVEINSTRFYENDVVIQKKNNYRAKVYSEDGGEEFVANGDIGKITSIKNGRVAIKFDNVKVRYTEKDMENVQLAYCTSIHSSQGGSIKYPIVVTPQSHTYFLNSNLLYVALTRTTRKCYHVGYKKTVNISVKKSEIRERNTALCDLLKQTAICVDNVK